MSRFVYATVLSLATLALAGCQEAPSSPNFASATNPNYATSGVCGALGDCPPSNTEPYAIQSNASAGP